MNLIKFEIGETDLYAYVEEDEEGYIKEDGLVFADKYGKVKIYCDLHTHTQLVLDSSGDYDMPFCPRCLKLKLKDFDDSPQIRVPYINEKKYSKYFDENIPKEDVE